MSDDAAERDWAALRVLGDDLAPMVGVSGSSLHRYRNGARPTPDAVAARLRVLDEIVTDLAGSYNDDGTRRWFTRPRQVLGGHSPNEALRGAWDPNASQPEAIRELAHRLTG